MTKNEFIEERVKEFNDTFQWHTNKSYVFVNDNKKLVEAFLRQSLEEAWNEGRFEGIEFKKNLDAFVQST